MSNGSAAYTRLSQDDDDLELELREPLTKEPKGIYFSDGSEPKKRIDYVLVYDTKHDSDSDDNEQNELQSLRQVFEDNLRKAGLLIEYDAFVLPEVRVDPRQVYWCGGCVAFIISVFAKILL